MWWSVELSEFDIHYEPKGPIKGHVYADFVVELVSRGPHPYPFSVDIISRWFFQSAK